MAATFDPAPRTLAQVQDPAWLGAMLSRRWPGVTVRSVRVVETLATQATKVRLALDVDGVRDDLPTKICIKGVLTDTGAPSSASIIETVFYRDLARRLPVRVPRCIHAELDDAGTNGVIVMADLKAQGATFLSALTPFGPAEARDTLEQLAMLHVSSWQGSDVFNQSAIPRFLDQISMTPIIPGALLQQMLDGPRGGPLPTSVKNAARLQRGLEALAAQVRDRPSCLVHGDAHAGNVYQTGRDFGLVDWQILQRGEWAQDVAYHIAAALSPEDRRTHERDLLDHYRDRLAALGGPALPADMAWIRYRAAMIYGFYLWSITRKVEPEITHEFVRRLGFAVDDLQSFAVVDA